MENASALRIVADTQRHAWFAGQVPPPQRVLPGLWCIPVPVDTPIRYTLVYALIAPEGTLLVDAGWATRASWQALQDGLRAAGTDVSEVRTVAITHNHPDHVGLAGRLHRATGATLLLHPLDHTSLGPANGCPERYPGLVHSLLAEHGADVESVTVRPPAEPAVPRMPQVPFTPIEDGDLISHGPWQLRTLWTPGHSSGSCCFYLEGHGLLFSGDHLLPRITPLVSVLPGSRPDPLSDYLHATEALLEQQLDRPITAVLPAHEYVFFDGIERLRTVLDHHAERLDEIERELRLRPGQSAWDLCSRLTWSRPWSSFEPDVRQLAMSETIAHLLHLQTTGRITASGTPRRWIPRPARRAALA